MIQCIIVMRIVLTNHKYYYPSIAPQQADSFGLFRKIQHSALQIIKKTH